MSKKTFTIIVVSILVVVLVLSVWFFFFRKGPDGGIGDDFLKNLFPFGQRDVVLPEPETPDVVSPTTPTGPAGIPRLRKLHGEPVSGAVAFASGNETKIRFVERATGHIFETYALKTNKVRLSNTTIPQIYEAYLSNVGDEILMRYLSDSDTIRTFYTKITNDTDQTISGVFLDDDIRHMSVFGNRVFYFMPSEDEYIGLVSLMDGSKKTAVFRTPFGGFIPRWVAPRNVVLVTAPKSSAQSTVYSLNTETGVYKKIMNQLVGGSGVFGTNDSVAFISAGGETIQSFIVETANQKYRELSLGTLADKCIFSAKDPVSAYCAVPKSIPSGIYPDSWYRGEVSFDDRVWKINTQTGETELVFDPTEEGYGEMDIEKLSMDQNEFVLIFNNKKDLSLWLYVLDF